MSQWLDNLNKESLLSIDKANLVDALFFQLLPIVEKIMGENGIYEDEAVLRLPIGLKYFYISKHFNDEVSNGGVFQYYINSNGIVSEELINSFLYFELPQVADIVKSSLQIAQNEKDIICKARDEWNYKVYSKTAELFSTITDQYTKHFENINNAWIRTIRNKIEDFILEGV